MMSFRPPHCLPSNVVKIVATGPSGLSCPNTIQTQSNFQRTVPSQPNGAEISLLKISFHAINLMSEWLDFSATCPIPLVMNSARMLSLVEFQLSDQPAEADWKICEDDLSCSAANFLSTIMESHRAKIEHSQLCKSDTSSVTTASCRTNPSRSTGSQKSKKHSRLQRLHQLTSAPALTVDSLAKCLHSIQVDEEDHSADVPIASPICCIP